jgi:hypothetical protein
MVATVRRRVWSQVRRQQKSLNLFQYIFPVRPEDAFYNNIGPDASPCVVIVFLLSGRPITVRIIGPTCHWTWNNGPGGGGWGGDPSLTSLPVIISLADMRSLPS